MSFVWSVLDKSAIKHAKMLYCLQREQPPEVARTPLEQLCLTVKTRFGSTHMLGALLSRMLTPPPVAAVTSAITSLTNLGALDAEEALTPLGRLLSQIPMDPRLAKTCIFACMLRSALLSGCTLACLHKPFICCELLQLFRSCSLEWILGNFTYLCSMSTSSMQLCNSAASAVVLMNQILSLCYLCLKCQ